MGAVRTTLRFREPVTLALLEDACLVVGVSLDDVLDDPGAALDGKQLPLSKAQVFLEAVCEDPPDLSGMPVEAAEATAALACADFFLNVSLKLSAARSAASNRYGGAPASRPPREAMSA